MKFGKKVSRKVRIQDEVLRKFGKEIHANLANYGYEVTVRSCPGWDTFLFVGLDEVDLKFLNRDFRQAVKDAIDQALRR